MTKKERVIAAIEQREIDGVPSSFSLHFPAVLSCFSVPRSPADSHKRYQW